MKRFAFAAVATIAAAASFAQPAGAQDIYIKPIKPQTSVTCDKALVECAFDLAVWAAQQADPVTIINTARGAVITVGNAVDDVCDIVLGTCNVPSP
jgi:hypothetical protein